MMGAEGHWSQSLPTSGRLLLQQALRKCDLPFVKPQSLSIQVISYGTL